MAAGNRKKKKKGVQTNIVQKPKTNEEILRNLYYSAKKPGSFSGVEAFWRSVNSTEHAHKFSRKNVKDFLLRNPAYFLWKPRRINFPRNKTAGVVTPGEFWAADIWILKKWQQFNSGYGYVLVALDMFSRFCAAVAMKSKDTQSVLEALKDVTDRHKFRVLFTDQEPALTNPEAQKFLKQRGIHHRTSRNQLHSYMAERMIQTLAVRLTKVMFARRTKKWTNLLPLVVSSYNATKHSQLCNNKYAPNDVNVQNFQEIYAFQYGTGKNASRPHVEKELPKFELGQTVLFSINDIDKFRKGYENRYKHEFFKITRIDSHDQIPMYTLATMDGKETLRGTKNVHCCTEKIITIPAGEQAAYTHSMHIFAYCTVLLNFLKN